MLKLRTPIILFPDRYDGSQIVRGEFDLRMQSFVFYLAPAQEEDGQVLIGTDDESGEEREIVFPEIIRTVKLVNNLAHPDPVISRIVERFVDVLEDVDEVIAAEQSSPGGIATEPFTVGTKKWFLHCDAKKRKKKQLGLRKIRKEIET